MVSQTQYSGIFFKGQDLKRIKKITLNIQAIFFSGDIHLKISLNYSWSPKKEDIGAYQIKSDNSKNYFLNGITIRDSIST